jgi:lipoate-protein ligase A
VLKEAFEKTFDVKLLADRLSDKEEAAAVELVKNKYSSDTWNCKK